MLSIVMLIIVLLSVFCSEGYPECHFAHKYYAKCRYANSRYTECRLLSVILKFCAVHINDFLSSFTRRVTQI